VDVVDKAADSGAAVDAVAAKDIDPVRRNIRLW
jgi:hypothetical protein